jgi:hypothetical protein
VRLRAARQDGERARLRGLLAAQQRRVEVHEPVSGGHFGQFGDHLRTGGGRLHPDLARVQTRHGLVDHVQHGRAVEEHGHDDIGPAYGVGGGIGDLDAVPGQRLGALAAAVPYADGMPALAMLRAIGVPMMPRPSTATVRLSVMHERTSGRGPSSSMCPAPRPVKN